MKLLFDNNLSHKLVERVRDIFPESSHVMNEGFDESDDKIIWEFAKENNYLIVTKDADFNELSLINGFPPKIIWIRIGNCRLKDIELLLRNITLLIHEFSSDDNSGVLEINQILTKGSN